VFNGLGSVSSSCVVGMVPISACAEPVPCGGSDD
jgi:hypothetical protein